MRDVASSIVGIGDVSRHSSALNLAYQIPSDAGSTAPQAAADQDPSSKEDSYLNRLSKFIPSEVLALYVTLGSALKADAAMPAHLYWFVLFFCAASTWVYLRKFQRVTSRVQLAISVGAFLVWAFAMGGPFVQLAWYRPGYGAVLLPTYTFLVALVG